MAFDSTILDASHHATLTKAITPLCHKMCPDQEIAERTTNSKLNYFECDEKTRDSWDGTKANERAADPNLMVKEFRRSDAGREMTPQMIRPHGVLLFTSYHLLLNVLSTKNNFAVKSEFASDRLRAVRQDLTILHDNSSQVYVEILEKSCKLHILMMYTLCEGKAMNYDSGLNGQYLNSILCNLRNAYEDHPKLFCNEARFRALLILLNAHSWDASEFKNMRNDLKESPEIQLAIRVYNSFRKSDAEKFFKLFFSSLRFLRSLLFASISPLYALPLPQTVSFSGTSFFHSVSTGHSLRFS